MHQFVALHILLVDDDLPSRRLVQLNLESFGYRVSSASNGHEAVQAYTERAFDLILMDLDMPEMDGLDATRRIREIEQADPAKPHVPIVALSGYVEAVDWQRCKAVGMDDHLAKGLIEPEILQQKLEQWLGVKSPPTD